MGAGSISPIADTADSFTVKVYSYCSISEGHSSSWDRAPGGWLLSSSSSSASPCTCEVTFGWTLLR